MNNTKVKSRLAPFCLKLVAGGAAYNSLEILWRGYTHISMTILGGLCFCMLLYLAGSKAALATKIIAGGSLITIAEFFTGCVVNIWLKLDVWDYSGEAFDVMGQICPRFSLLWCLLSAAVIYACGYARLNFAFINDKIKLFLHLPDSAGSQNIVE